VSNLTKNVAKQGGEKRQKENSDQLCSNAVKSPPIGGSNERSVISKELTIDNA